MSMFFIRSNVLFRMSRRLRSLRRKPRSTPTHTAPTPSAPRRRRGLLRSGPPAQGSRDGERDSHPDGHPAHPSSDANAQSGWRRSMKISASSRAAATSPRAATSWVCNSATRWRTAGSGGSAGLTFTSGLGMMIAAASSNRIAKSRMRVTTDSIRTAAPCSGPAARRPVPKIPQTVAESPGQILPRAARSREFLAGQQPPACGI